MEHQRPNEKTNGTNGCVKEKSNLFKIEVPSDNPFDLFKEWYKQAQDANVIMPNALNLATSDGDGRVSSRTLLMRRLLDDGLLLMTDSRSKKSYDLKRCARAAITFLWMYPKQPKGIFVQQVRIEGYISELPFDEHVDLYHDEPLFCKIRSAICRQGEYVDWSEHKKFHDLEYKKCLEKGSSASLNDPPQHYVLYKVHPEMMEFYMADESSVGDRVVFRVADKPNLIPAKALDPSSQVDCSNLAETFRNGLKIAHGEGERDFKSGPKKWIHYNVCA